MKLKPLFYPINENYTFSNFLIAKLIESAAKIDWLKKITKHASSITLITAQAGSGKTHLLKALVNRASNQKISTLYLPFTDEKIGNIIEISKGLNLLCLDGIETLKKKENQLLIYELINKNCLNLVISSRITPKDLVIINDLKTRLLSGRLINISHLNESQSIEAIKIKSKEKGIKLSKRVFEQFFIKSERNMHKLNSNLNELIYFAASKKISLSLLNEFFENRAND